jgi:outer membrane protein assembly factor BamB
LKKHLLTLALAASVIGGCRQQEAPPSDTGKIQTLPAQSFKRDWGADLELKNDSVSRVFVREDLVIAYTKKNMAYVLNRGSGVVRFTAQVNDSPIPALEPVVLKERIVFPTNSTLEIYKRDGRFERSYTTSSSLRTNAVGVPGGSMVFFGVDARSTGRLVAVDTLPGQYKPVNERWELMDDHGAPISSAPAVTGGIVYVAFDDGEVYAVNQDNRQAIWSTSTGQTFKTYGAVKADLRADESGVYVPSTDFKLYCLDKTQGWIKWSYYAGAPLRDSPEVTATTLYVPVPGRGIVALDKTAPGTGRRDDRKPRWAVKDAVKFLAEDEKYAYLSRADHVVVAVDKATGEQKFTSRRTDFVAFATNTKDSTIYAATKDGQVLAIVPVLKAGNVGELALDNGRPVEAVALR